MGRACLQDAGPIAASRVFSQMHGQQRVQAAQAHSTMLAGRCAAPMSLLNTPLGRTPAALKTETRLRALRPG